MTHIPCDLIITRHGETEWNLLGRHQGQLDSPLSPLGIAQAEAFGETVRELPVTAIYASDLGRTMETARIIAGRLSIPEIIPEPLLREVNFGILQGYTVEEFRTAHPDIHARHLERDPDYQIPGGESLRQFQERTLRGLDDIARRHPGQTVLVVAHGGNLGCVFRHVFGIPFGAQRRFSLKNVSFNRFTVSDGAWRLETWGEISHLRKVRALDELG